MLPRFQVSRSALPRLSAGHPWLYRQALRALAGTAQTGDVVELCDDRRTIARGVYDAESPLAVRVWCWDEQALDAKCVAQRLAHALDLRARLFDPAQTNAVRLLHGEADRMPGVVVDRYADVAVLRTDGEAVARWLTPHRPKLDEALRALGVTTLLHRRGGPQAKRSPLETLWGEAPRAPVPVVEHGMPFLVDLVHGQKTGAFLDQRDNRRRIRELTQRGTRVLNLFSYAGGFSLAAALGGATQVTSVDIAHDAHRIAQQSFRLAGVDPATHAFVTADAFQWLDDAAKRGERFDLIVSDPPSFAPNEKSVPKALAAYKRLHRGCTRLLADGGIFCAASCSSHVDARLFVDTLDDATLERRPLRIVEQRGAPPDHPVLAAFPEGAYLKFFVLR